MRKSEYIRNLCISRNYFTCGGNRQYEKMFELADNGCNNHDIAVIIWICSDKATLEQIEQELAEIDKRMNETVKAKSFILISVFDRIIHTKNFTSHEEAYTQMINEISQEIDDISDDSNEEFSIEEYSAYATNGKKHFHSDWKIQTVK